ncbi:glycosyltransferase family 2 protein [Thermodesulfobacteriota bacterium]
MYENQIIRHAGLTRLPDTSESGTVKIPDAPAVYAIVLNWNSWKETIRCINFLKKSEYNNLHIIVVDNASQTEQDFEKISAMSEVHLIKARRNIGYGGGNNLGIMMALEAGAEFLCLLNPDVIVEAGTLKGLVETLKSDPRIGMIGPKFVFEDKPDIIRNAGYFLQPEKGCILTRCGFRENDGEQHSKPLMEADFISGSCMMIRREAVEDIGLIAEHFFLYWEDVEWCHRALSKEWKVAVNQRAKVFHNTTKKVNQRAPNYYHYFFTRNHLRFVRDHYPEALPKALIRSTLRIVNIMRLNGRYRGKMRLSIAGSIIKAIFHGTFFHRNL